MVPHGRLSGVPYPLIPGHASVGEVEAVGSEVTDVEGVPIRPGDVLSDASAALKGELSHADLSVYNAVQKLLYLGVILAGIVIVLSGLSIWKPVQLQELTALFGGYDAARYVHFFAMAAIVGFIVIHIVMALLVPRALRAMITGR